MRALSLATLLSFATLTGCSTSPYQKQVSDLSTALTDVQSSFETLSQTEQQAFVASQTALGLQKGNQFYVPSECSNVENKKPVNCIPYISGTDNQSIVYKPAGPYALKLAKSLATYGTSLVTLAQAQDISDLNSAVAKSESAISKLASDVKMPSQQVGAVGSFVTWAAGEYLNALRFEQLKNIVNEADPLIARASVSLASAATILKKNIIAQKSVLLQNEQTLLFDMRQGKPPPPTNSAILTTASSLVSDGVSLQSLAETDVTKPFVAMRKAHKALLASLNDPQVSPETVFNFINDFVTQASALKTGLEKSKPSK